MTKSLRSLRLSYLSFSLFRFNRVVDKCNGRLSHHYICPERLSGIFRRRSFAGHPTFPISQAALWPKITAGLNCHLPVSTYLFLVERARQIYLEVVRTAPNIWERSCLLLSYPKLTVLIKLNYLLRPYR